MRGGMRGVERLSSSELLQSEEFAEFICPITMELMRDPVSTLDGQTYERAAIEAWLAEHDTSPLTGEKLSSKVLIPNVFALTQIEWLCEQRNQRQRQKQGGGEAAAAAANNSSGRGGRGGRGRGKP